MRITYVSASIIPSTNANSVNVMKMCNAFAENGHEVTLVATKGSAENPFTFYKVKEGFQLKLGRNNKISSLNRLCCALKYSNEADIVYTRWIVAAVFLVLFTQKKIVYEHHAPFQKGLNKLFEKYIIRSKKICRHVFITQSLKDHLVKLYPKLIEKDLIVLPDGADLIECEEGYHIEKDIDCIYVGSFQTGKGVDTVIGLANRLSELKFAVVGGSKNEVAEMSNLNLAKNIHWFGFLPHENTYNILKRAKIALVPNHPNVLVGKSKQDIGNWTSPLKLFEYMAASKAIVASDLKVLREILVDGENSLLVSYDNLDSWEGAVRRLLSDSDLIKTISIKASQDLKNKYTWEKRALKAVKGFY